MKLGLLIVLLLTIPVGICWGIIIILEILRMMQGKRR